MRVAVAGATGRIGRLVWRALERRQHEVRPISRAHGVDVWSGEGLLGALAGVDVVVDVTNTTVTDEAAAVDFFDTATQQLLAAERSAGVSHHVVLSIAGVSRVRGNAHYAGKRAQEAAVTAGDIPYTIVPATQFHDFAEMVASWTEENGVALVPPLLVQPVAPSDVADVLAHVATNNPRGHHVDVAGPEVEDLVDMARRTLAARGRNVELVPSWHTGIFGVEMAGDVLLPSDGAHLAPTSFDAWLATVDGRASDSAREALGTSATVS
ncbi:SDR family oxidoreductase [Nocardioides panacisoli]|uniref:SDR family oxidoreductase n=1 Tax=Nocardioides panacisoli TaxID=627624 RepID=UPI001C632F78|nr:SDR family oxidoreductase [Nocardioides panacisoli]QYJ03547.1 SDR family oxidoreductase [Nocardioides panacisoli]